MRWLIALLILVLLASDLFGLNLSLAPGVSVKNAFVYVVAVGLLFRIVMEGESRLELGVVHACFVILIGYAILTWLLAALVIEYPGYRFLDSAVTLKARLVDPAVFFFAAFHGTRDMKDVRVITMTLAAVLIIGNAFAVTDVIGWTDLGIRIGESGAEAGRIFGAFGHANDTAALIVALLPAIVALALSSGTFGRLLWLAGALVTAAVLLMTVSRGAYVGVVVGSLIAAWLCRQVIPARRAAGWAVIVLFVTVLLVAAVSVQVGDLLSERVLGQTAVRDVGEASSGRTDIWWTAIERMFAAPITLFTGYGWGVYEAMPFRFVPHNHYLGLWFDLGLVGLGAYLVILVSCVRIARKALEKTTGDLRRLITAFIFGICMLSVAVFFTDLTNPWLYVWAYVGVSTRAALLALRAPAKSPARPAPRPITAWSHDVATGRPGIFGKRPTT
jgi:O-antigen ligase